MTAATDKTSFFVTLRPSAAFFDSRTHPCLSSPTNHSSYSSQPAFTSVIKQPTMSTPTAPPRSSANRDGQHHKQAAKSKKKQQQAEKRCNSPTAGDWNELFEALEANGGLSAFGNSLNQFLQSPIAEQRGFNHRKIRQAHKRYTKFQTKRETAAKTKRKSKGNSNARISSRLKAGVSSSIYRASITI